jgi:predicted amidophosphoribosyltransferase
MEDTRSHSYHPASPDYEEPPECQECGAPLEPNTGAFCPACIFYLEEPESWN